MDKDLVFRFMKWVSVNGWVYHQGLSRWITNGNLESGITSNELLSKFNESNNTSEPVREYNNTCFRGDACGKIGISCRSHDCPYT